MTIPHILHQTWSSATPPEPLAAWRRQWVRRHPHWDHRLWDDADCRSFMRDEAPAVRGAWERMPHTIMRVDLFRYCVVRRFGGMYADLDMRSFRVVDPLLEGASCVLSVEAHLTGRRQRELGYRRARQLANCVFAATPGHPFLSQLIERSTDSQPKVVGDDRGGEMLDDDGVEDWTGPRMLTRAFEVAPPNVLEGVRVLPQVYLMAPKEYPPGSPLGLRVFARHEALGTWKVPRRLSPQRRLIERNRLPNPFPRRRPAAWGDEASAP